jgi:TRAP-type C4-dicarboxylate transport system permease small subunit
MKKVLTIILTLFIVSNTFVFLSINSVFAETAKEQFESGLTATADKTGHMGIAGLKDKSLAEIIGIVIKAFLSFLGVIFLILMIYGGYIWMMARGNEQEVARAKNIIINALIGLVIVLAAYAITLIMYKFYVVREYAG